MAEMTLADRIVELTEPRPGVSDLIREVEALEQNQKVLDFLRRLSVECECRPSPKFEGWTPGQVVRYIRAAIADDVMVER